jgi:hypothetical protein
VVSQFALTLFSLLQINPLAAISLLFGGLRMKHAQELFSFRHSERDITVWRRGRGNFKRYIGAINGEVCAEGLAKGELLRELIEMARSYPKSQPRRVVARPGNTR